MRSGKANEVVGTDLAELPIAGYEDIAMDRDVVLGRWDIRLNNPVPRIVIILPSLSKSRLQRPKDWLRGHHRTYELLLVFYMHS